MFAVVASVSGALTVWEVLIEAWDKCLRVASFLPHQQPHEEVLFETVLEMKNHRSQGRWPSPPHPGMQAWTVCRTLFILLLPPPPMAITSFVLPTEMNICGCFRDSVWQTFTVHHKIRIHFYFPFKGNM